MTSVTFWKEINSRLPSLDGALHEFFKNENGSSMIKKPIDNRNTITLFMKKDTGKQPETEYIHPDTLAVEFVNNGGDLGISINKKDMRLSWSGKPACTNQGMVTSCVVESRVDDPVALFGSPKEGLRMKPAAKKVLKRKEQERISFKTGGIDLWTGAKTNVRDINQVAAFGASVAAGGAAFASYFLPAMGLLLVASPMAIGATSLANGESAARNNNGHWYLDGNMNDDGWISALDVSPRLVKKVTIFQDDEFYFHARVDFDKKLSCKVTEESDIVSIYPARRLTCDG